MMTSRKSRHYSRRLQLSPSAFLLAVIVGAFFHFDDILFYVHAFTLITFDVDGTLIQGSGQAAEASAHARAFSHAVGTVLGGGVGGEDNERRTSSTVIIPPVAQALPQHLYHGSTDGLILLRLAKATLGVEAAESFPRLDDMMDCMYQYMLQLEESEISRFISPLPGVMEHLTSLATQYKDSVMCGLVTGNVEGIARLKMKTVGIYDTGALAEPCESQKVWHGTEHIAFLGGFGSDFCSGDISNLERNHLDRGEQIAIAAKRCQALLQIQATSMMTTEAQPKTLKRVVHVGDAPADVLAAKSFSETMLKSNENGDDLCVGMIAVATGSYPADQLRELAGAPIPGKWEPVILERGMGDSNFLQACGL